MQMKFYTFALFVFRVRFAKKCKLKSNQKYIACACAIFIDIQCLYAIIKQCYDARMSVRRRPYARQIRFTVFRKIFFRQNAIYLFARLQV